MIFVYVALIAFFSGLVKGTSGFGSSLVAVPLLLLIYPKTEVVVIMITFNVILNTSLLFENKSFDIKVLKDVWVIVLFGIVFTFIGLFFLMDMDDNYIKYLAAILILLAISNRVFDFKFKFKDNFINQAITGIFSGLGNGVATIDGPPVVFFLTGIRASKAKFKNTLASYFLFLGIASVGMLVINMEYSVDILLNTGYIVIFGVLGVISGMKVSSRLNEERFEKVIIVLLVLIGISMFIF